MWKVFIGKKKLVFFFNDSGIIACAHGKNRLWPLSHTMHRNSFKVDNGHKYKSKTKKLLEKNVEEYLYDLRSANSYWGHVKDKNYHKRQTSIKWTSTSKVHLLQFWTLTYQNISLRKWKDKLHIGRK